MKPCRAARAALWLVLLAPPPLTAHTPITTRYGFADDVLPVLEKRCVRCHFPGGPTPMSLRTYKEARPWAESIKEQVLARGMPPLFVEHGSAPVQNGSPLTARELDVLVDWASGGAPEGSRAASKGSAEVTESSPSRGETGPAGGAAEPEAEWRVYDWDGFLGPADQDATELHVSHRAHLHEAKYATGWTLESDPRWLRGAVLWIEGAAGAGAAGPRTTAADVFLGSWVAGDEPFLFPGDAAFDLHPGARIRVDARYKRTWLLRARLEPRTRLRMRFASRAPSRRVISAAVPLGERNGERFAAGGTVLAFFPSAPGAGKLLLEREGPSGFLLDLYRVTEDWPVMYRFAAPEVGLLVLQPAGPPSDAAIGGYALYVTDR